MERAPQQRLALRKDMLRLWGHVSDGKVPLAEKYEDLGVLATRLTKEKNIQAREKIEAQMVQELQKNAPAHELPTLSKSSLVALKQQISNQPNPDKRRQMENRLNQLEQSLNSSQQARASMNQIDEVSARAAKRNRSLQTKRDTWVTERPMGTGYRGNFPGSRSSTAEATATTIKSSTRCCHTGSPVAAAPWPATCS